MFQLSDYQYILPEDRIAQYPVTPAHNSKLLSCHIDWNQTLTLSDHHCFDLPHLLEKDTLLIANNSQVFASRIPLHNIKVILKNREETFLENGEIFIVRVVFHDDGSLDTSKCIIRWSDKKHFRPGNTIFITENIYGISKEFVDDGIVREIYGIDLITLCNEYGDMPLPPYITQTDRENQSKYTTSFGKHIWSVATPTAGLHFTESLRKDLQYNSILRQEITLHVGIGTFAPVVNEDIRNHQLHSELITISRDIFKQIYKQKEQNKKVITIWTTSTRTIESLPYLFGLLDTNSKTQHLAQDVLERRDTQSILQKNDNFLLLISVNSHTITFSSSLFIYPWYKRKIIDGLITNFHLPQTSLVMLVAGLIGHNNRQHSYAYALQNDYRFASFWDAMLIQF